MMRDQAESGTAEDAKIPEILEQGMFIKLSGGSPLISLSLQPEAHAFGHQDEQEEHTADHQGLVGPVQGT